MSTAPTPTTTAPASCGSCGVHSCEFNAEASLCRVPLGREAWLLDEVWPEFDAYLGGRSAEDPLLLTAWGSRGPKPPAYHWPSNAGHTTIGPSLLTLKRSLRMRGSKWSGGKRQSILEEFDHRYARWFARRIPYNVLRLVVWQNFAPFLQQDKTLGGRDYEILAWRAPRHVLQETLNLASQHYPESATLRDFRSDPALVEAERTAFTNARRIVTPHRDLAKLYPEKTTVLDWSWPAAKEQKPRGSKIAFLGPTVGRRGAYFVRDALRKLKLPLVAIGRNLEQPDFWRGLEVEEREPGEASLRDVGLIVSPALTDFKPRRIMQALSSGIPVITTPACGLPPTDDLHFTDPFNADALAEKIATLRPK